MEYYGSERELSRTTKLEWGHSYPTLPEEGQTYLARAFLSKKMCLQMYVTELSLLSNLLSDLIL
jgi:hypothetical protein